MTGCTKGFVPVQDDPQCKKTKWYKNETLKTETTVTVRGKNIKSKQKDKHVQLNKMHKVLI